MGNIQTIQRNSKAEEASNLPTIILNIVECIPELIESIVEAILSNIPTIIQCGIELLTSLITKLPTIIMEIVKAIPEIIAGIVEALAKGIPQIVNIGAQLIKGLWEGIKSVSDWIWDKISGFFDGIVGGIKKFFGIHSPSRVFAGIGENLGLGLEGGFLSSMKDAEKLMTEAVPTDFDIRANAKLDSVAYDKAPTAYSVRPGDTGGQAYGSSSRAEELSLLREQNSILRAILEKDFSVFLGDDEIGRANSRYEGKRGIIVNEGGFKNAY